MGSSRDTVLLLTHDADPFSVDRVAAAVSRRGARPVRIDVEGVPSRWALTSVLGPSGEDVVLHTPAGAVHAWQVHAVWLRRRPPLRLEGALDGLAAAGCRFINPLEADAAAENTARQLRLARQLGLEVPRTVVTNDPARVRAFFEEVQGRMVAKRLTPTSPFLGGDSPFEHLADLRHGPLVFQERLDTAYALRVAVVGARCFTGAVEASCSAAGPEARPWTHGVLPSAVAGRLVRLVAALGLVCAAADFIVTPEGRCVFLEVNPGGEWGMLERDLGLPISEALAEALSAPLPRSGFLPESPWPSSG
ncbi:MvdC/MvdD family ATP grasp protein [Archangium primigenium]|uniref:MvdC/MvdD family ATP grasp protein n=1 Tax=[Archangium] primigenium TaxID=2792470 RepID=UPI00195CC2C1|nr:MvdC family ATP-grasp ribosomal peptide maturase [Archangium primigenium]MBM7118464.1 MvdC family ATP-grasp ribosomal peptide maturase [Archangium primigenium]